jgi:PASTA domain-containing protein
MGSVMAARLSALLPRLAVLTVIWLLATSTITFAAGGRNVDATPAPVAGPKEPAYMVVPDVREQAYVFAKGILADAGFAWKVAGPVEGYAANTVVSQDPAPGTKLEDTGAPTIVLRLAKNPGYTEKGLPENRSGVDGTAVVLAGAPVEEAPAPAPEPAAEPPAEEAPAEEPPAEEPAPTKDKKADAKADDKAREPDFVVPGAPPEPTDELPLPMRATLLEKRMNGAAKPTGKLVNYWLYQHSWIVTGASFGWSGGDDALRTLIRTDLRLQQRFGFGKKSAAVARATLADVQRRSTS